ncbi:MAG: hypothetical protein NTY44_06880, partial [Deltaproteobacteria bacterium]|nr:hypothetical protein [Deltaproteobacteria bacterium]
SAGPSQKEPQFLGVLFVFRTSLIVLGPKGRGDIFSVKIMSNIVSSRANGDFNALAFHGFMTR